MGIGTSSGCSSRLSLPSSYGSHTPFVDHGAGLPPSCRLPRTRAAFPVFLPAAASPCFLDCQLPLALRVPPKLLQIDAAVGLKRHPLPLQQPALRRGVLAGYRYRAAGVDHPLPGDTAVDAQRHGGADGACVAREAQARRDLAVGHDAPRGHAGHPGVHRGVEPARRGSLTRAQVIRPCLSFAVAAQTLGLMLDGPA